VKIRILPHAIGLLFGLSCGGMVAVAQEGIPKDSGAVGVVTSEAAPEIEVAFGPEGGAEALVVKFIASAGSSIRLAGYAFSSPVVVDSLAAAARRGVDVQVVLDHGHNVTEDDKGIGRKALARLARAHVVIRTSSAFRHLHDKFIVADARHVQTGSYNYSKSANLNSENVLVIWRDPALAAKYLRHWQSRFESGKPWLGQE
jgi:phosphatidylserine/phosphatidylglycerophosphate/cardiolipin synthase-like enzyme